MSSVESRFEDYIDKYSQYAVCTQEMQAITAHKESVSGVLAQRKAERAQEQQKKSALEKESADVGRRLISYKTILDQSQGTVAGTPGNADPSVGFEHNDFTDPVRFQKKQDEIKADYQKRLDNYYSRTKLALEDEKRTVNEQLEQVQRDKAAYAEAKMESISTGCAAVVEAKKKEVTTYLTYNSKIKSAARPILDALSSEKPSREACGTSEEAVIQRVVSLEGTDKYPRRQKVELRDFRMDRSSYRSTTLIPFLLIVGIGLMVLFTMGFTPMKFIVPSSTSVAGVGQKIGDFFVRLLVGLFLSAIIGGVIYLFLRGISDTVAVIAVVAATIGILIMVFGPEFGDTLSVESVMGFGKAVHGVLLFVLNLALSGVIVVLLFLLITNTQLVGMFFKPNYDIVQAGVQAFAEYFERNRDSYLMLFNITDAVSSATENRLAYALSACDSRIANIQNDKEYRRLVANRDDRLAERCRIRDEQLGKLTDINRSLTSSFSTLADQAEALGHKIHALDVEISKLTDDLQKTQEREDALRPKLDDMTAALKKETDKITRKDGQGGGEYAVPNTARQLLDCEGKLAKNLYLVRNKPDESGLAVVRKLPLKCEHTIFTYDRSEISGNNLSEELGLFIIWFTMSMLNVNPRELLLQGSGNLNMGQKVQVVDLVSGQSVLTMAPYNHVFQVVSDQKEKNALAEKLEAVIRGITMDLDRSDLRGDGVHMTDLESLNQRKMQINKPDIERVPDLPASRLVEPIRRYSLLFFIVPPASASGTQLSVLSEELKRVMVNSARYGIIPVFLVDSETLTDVRSSEDAAYLSEVQNKSVWHIRNVGKDRGELLDIE